MLGSLLRQPAWLKEIYQEIADEIMAPIAKLEAKED